MADGVAVRLLGPVRLVTSTGTEVAFRGHVSRLLAWLALHPDRVWTADDLAARLWPEGPPPTARTAIQGHVSRLRRTLTTVDGVGIDSTGGGYALRSRPGAVDVHCFITRCDEAAAAERDGLGPAAAADLLAAALDLWSGDALGELRADPLLGPEARALEDQRRDAEERLAEALVGAGRLDRALALLGRLVNDEPLRERRWALLMTALTRAGRQADALRAYRQAAATLVERTGLDPGPELQRLETAILLQDPALDAARWQPAPGTAPAPLIGLVGREREHAAVVRRLRTARLVTVVGAGGVGKTTLAIDVGASETGSYADGVVVVDLAVAGADTVDATIASAVGAAAEGEDHLARAAAALARRHVLVVLDNCEHVAPAAAHAALALLQADPGLRVLATSQVPLGVAGEAVVVLGPLPVPPEGAPLDSVRRSPAVELLAHRLDDLGCPPAGEADWRHAATIVRALDGLPLALEIAAASARVEPLGTLARRLAADSSAVLAADPPVGAGRRRLGAALDAAVARLDPTAADVYALASIFPTGFDASAAAAVAKLDEDDARAVMAQLADASLVVLDDPERTRARLLQPVRAHAAALLGREGRALAEERLTEWCLTLAESLDRRLHTPQQAEVIERFMTELPLFRTVLRRLLDAGGPDEMATATRLFVALAPCWSDSPAGPEAATWGDELLARSGDLDPGLRARLAVAIINTLFAFELMAARYDLAVEASHLGEQAGDPFVVAAARLLMAIGLGWRGTELDRAGVLLAQARDGMLACGDLHRAAVATEFQGLLALRRLDFAGGIAKLEASVAEHRAVGSPGDVAHSLTYIGYARRAIGDNPGALRAFDEARLMISGTRVATWFRAAVGSGHASLALGDTRAASETFREAHDRAVEVGDHRIIGTALVGLASVARGTGDDERCVALLRAATDEALAGGDPTDAVTAAGMLAEMLADRGADDEAAVLLGAAEVVRDEVGVRVDFGLAYDAGPLRRTLAERLGEERLAAHAAEGRTIGLAALVRRASDRLLVGGVGGEPAPALRLVDGGAEIHLGIPGRLAAHPHR